MPVHTINTLLLILYTMKWRQVETREPDTNKSTSASKNKNKYKNKNKKDWVKKTLLCWCAMELINNYLHFFTSRVWLVRHWRQMESILPGLWTGEWCIEVGCSLCMDAGCHLTQSCCTEMMNSSLGMRLVTTATDCTDLFHIANVSLLQGVQSHKLKTLRNHIEWLVECFCHHCSLIGANLRAIMGYITYPVSEDTPLSETSEWDHLSWSRALAIGTR